MAEYRISALLTFRDQLTSKLKSAQNAIKSLGKATADVERGMGSVGRGISGVTRGIGDFKNQDLKVRLGVEGLERVERLKSTLESAGMKVSRPINIRANDEATSRLQRIKSELQSLVSKPWTAVVNIKENAKAALGKMKTGVGEMVGGAAMGMGATMLGTAGVGYGVVNAVQSQMNFEKQMSAVKAVLSGTYKGEELNSVMTQLTAKAEEMGATTKFTAKEAAEGLYFMGMAGWKAEQMTAGLPPILKLAAAGNTDLATTSDIVTDSMTGFGVKAGQLVKNTKGELVESTQHYADLMATLVTNANTDIPMLGETLKYAAPLVGAMYSNQDETARMTGAQDMMLVAGLMANAGIKSSQAGTSARALFSRLGSQNRNADFARQFLNVDFKDEQTGEVRRMKDFFGDLRTKFQKGMDINDLLEFAEDLEGTKLHADTRRKLESSLKSAQERGGKMTGSEMLKMAAMLSGQEAMSGLLAVMTASEEDWSKLSEALDNAEGAADRMSKIQLDNLAGDITIMGSAWDAFQRNLVKGKASEGLRGFAQAVTDTLSKANELFKDGIDIGDFGAIIIDVIAKLKAKFVELDGIGSLLAGGALIMGMKKVLTLALTVKDTLSAWAKVRNAGDVGGLIRGGKSAGAGGLTSVGALNVRAGSVSIRAAVVNLHGAIKGMAGGAGGAGGRGAIISANQQRVNDYYNRRQQILTATRPTTVPPTAAAAGAASVLKSGLKMAGGAGIMTAVFGALDVMSVKTNSEYMLSAAQADVELAKNELKILREQNADVEQINGQLDKIRQAEDYVKQVRITNAENERRANSGAAGMVAGSMAGAALGSVVPILGTTIGAILGGVLGQWAGEKSADSFIESERARREEAASTSADVSMSDFRRAQDEGYQRDDVLKKYSSGISERQSADLEEHRLAEQMKSVDAVTRGQIRRRIADSQESSIHQARKSEYDKLQEQIEADRARREDFGQYTKVEKTESGYEAKTYGAKISRQEAAGYTSLNDIDTGKTGLESFGVMKTAEQVKAEVAERKRETDLLNEFGTYENRWKALEEARKSQGSVRERLNEMFGIDAAARETIGAEVPIREKRQETGAKLEAQRQVGIRGWLNGMFGVDTTASEATSVKTPALETPEEVNAKFGAREHSGGIFDVLNGKIEAKPTDPYAGLKQTGVQQTGMENRGVMTGVQTPASEGTGAKITPASPYDGMSKYGGQKTGLESWGAAAGAQTSVSTSEQISTAFKNVDFAKAGEMTKSAILTQIGAIFDPLGTILGTSRAHANATEPSVTAQAPQMPNLSDFKLPEINVGEKISSELETASSKINDFKNTASEKFSSVGEAASTTFEGFKAAASSTFDEATASVSEKFSNVGEKISAGLERGKAIFDSFKSAASASFDEINASIGEKFSGIGEAFSSARDSVTSGITEIGTTISEGFSGAFESMSAAAATGVEALATTFSAGFETLLLAAGTSVESLSMTLSTGFEAITAGVTAAFETITLTASTGLETLQMTAATALESMSMTFSTTFEAILATTTAAFESVSATISTSVEAAHAAISSAFSSAAAEVQGIWGAIPGFFSGVFGGLGGIAAAAGSAIAAGINSGIGMIQSAWEALSGWLSAKISSLATMAASAAASIGIGGNASGTSSWRGGFTTVNEHGGELIILPSGKVITPYATAQEVIAHNYGGTANFGGGFTTVNEHGGELIILPNGEKIYPQATTTSAIGDVAHNYSGTSYFEGGWSEVNGTGSELMYLPRGTKIIPHATTVRILRNQVREKLKEQSSGRFIKRAESTIATVSGLDNAFKRESAGQQIATGGRDLNAAPAIIAYRRNKELFSSTTSGLLSQNTGVADLGKLKGVEIPEYNRITSEDSLAVRRAKREAQIRAMSVARDYRALAETDTLGNLKGIEVPEYNQITASDSVAVRRAKFEAQRRQYLEEQALAERGYYDSGLNSSSGNVANIGGSLSKYRAEIAHNYGGTTNFEGGLSTVNEHGGEIIQLPSGKAIYPQATAQKVLEREIKTDRPGNIRGLEVPSYNRITGGDSIAVRNAKYRAQLRQLRNQPRTEAHNSASETITSVVEAGKPSRGSGKNIFEKGTEAVNDFFFKLFHPRKYAEKQAKSPEIKVATASVGEPSLFQRATNSVNDFFFKLFHPRKYAAKKAGEIARPDTKVTSGNAPANAFESINNYFYKLFHPRKYAAKKAAEQKVRGVDVKTAAVPDKKSGFQLAMDSVNDFFFKLFHPRKHAKQQEDIFQQTVNNRAATLNAASETNVADAVNSSTKQGDIFSNVDWGGLLTAIFSGGGNQRILALVRAFTGGNAFNLTPARGRKSNISSTSISFNSEYAEKRRAGQANWIKNLEQLNPNSPVRTFGIADTPIISGGVSPRIRIQSAGLPTSGSNTGGLQSTGLPTFGIETGGIQSVGLPTSGSNAGSQDIFSSIGDFFFRIFHPQKNGNVTNATAENGKGGLQQFFDSANDFFFKLFHPRKYAVKKRGSDELGNINGLNGLASNVISESDSAEVRAAKREAQIREFNRQNSQSRGKNFLEKTWEAVLGFIGGGKKINPIGEVDKPTTPELQKSADIFQKELPPQARSLDPSRKTQAEKLYDELSAKYAELEKFRNTSKPVGAVTTQTRDLSSAGMTAEQLQEMRRQRVLSQVAERNAENLREMHETGYDATKNTYSAAASAENLAAFRARIERNQRDSEALAKIRRESVRKQLAERNFTASEESMQSVRELNAVAVARATSERDASDSSELTEINRIPRGETGTANFYATLEKNRRDSEALAKIRRESVRKQLAERNFTASEESMQSVRELNEAALQRARSGREGVIRGSVKPAEVSATEYRAKLEKNARDSEILAEMRRESVRRQLAERNFTASGENQRSVRELNAAAVAREASERNSSKLTEIKRAATSKTSATNFYAALEKNRRDSEALAKIRRESVAKRLAERNFAASEESMQSVRELNEAAVARAKFESNVSDSARLADIRRTASLENLREIQRLRESGAVDGLNADNSLMAGNFFSAAAAGELGELPVPKLTEPTVDGGTTNSTSSNTTNTTSANFNFGDVNINNGADFEEFMHRLKTLFTQSAENYAGA